MHRAQSRALISVSLGFISRLRDENSCRIVLICNTTEFSAGDKEAVAKFREKVIDRHISFNPSIESNLRLLFDSSSNSIEALFVKLRLNNIRVMQQTKWAIEYFSDALKLGNEEVRQDALIQIARLAIVHYAYPTIMKVRELETKNWMVELWHEKENHGNETSKKLELVQQLGYGPSALDPLVISYLESGYCDQAILTEVIATLNVGDIIQRGKDEIYALWTLIYGNFSISSDEIGNRFQACVIKYGDTVHL